MGYSFALAFEASQSIGLGHISRCLSLQQAARELGLSARLLIGDGCDCVLVRRLTDRHDLELLATATPAPGEILLGDLSHPRNLRTPAGVATKLAAWRQAGGWVSLIDALGNQALRAHLPAGIVDRIILPYVHGADELLPPGALAGPEFFVLAPAYQSPSRAIRQVCDRILVSCGGSDPTGTTLTVLEALARLAGNMTVTVVVGPAFSAALCREIDIAAKQFPHRITLAHAPADLAELMRWCDLAVTMTGLTKYELAATGTPAVLLSLDSSHALVHRPFEALHTAVHLGEVSRVDAAVLAQSIDALRNSPERRAAMAQAGQTIVDGHGAARMLKVLKDSFDASR